MGRIYLIRHGEVEFNRANAYIGWTDLHLNETGRRQASLIADYLESKGISAVYASDLSRARQTAAVLAARLNLTVQVVPEIRELNYGEWEGTLEADVPRLYPEIRDRWIERPEDTRIPGGETAGELRDRAYPAFLRIAEAHVHDNVAVTGHKSTNRIILCCILGVDINRYRYIGQANAAVNVIEVRDDGRMVVEKINETCHLQA